MAAVERIREAIDGMPNDENGDFREYRRLIMEQLHTLARRADLIESEITTLRVKQATIMVKVGLIGSGAGLVAGAVVAKIISYL